MQRCNLPQLSPLTASVLCVAVRVEKAHNNLGQIRRPADVLVAVVAALLEPMELDRAPRFAPRV